MCAVVQCKREPLIQCRPRNSAHALQRPFHSVHSPPFHSSRVPTLKYCRGKSAYHFMAQRANARARMAELVTLSRLAPRLFATAVATSVDSVPDAPARQLVVIMCVRISLMAFGHLTANGRTRSTPKGCNCLPSLRGCLHAQQCAQMQFAAIARMCTSP